MEKRPIEILETLCKEPSLRNANSSLTASLEITNRAKFICNMLDSMGISYTIDRFARTKGFGLIECNLDRIACFYNIEVEFKSAEETQDSVMFVSHHDIANPKSENCQDNSASIVNVLSLCSRLKDKKDLDKNVFVVFTDSEEYGGIGAERVAHRIWKMLFGNVICVFNSELTAKGSKIWMEEQSVMNDFINANFDHTMITTKRCPFNDSVIFREYNIPSICFGILAEEEINNPFPKSWAVCHRMDDTFDQANEQDMKEYVDFLESLI